jgi:hypothetical protein
MFFFHLFTLSNACVSASMIVLSDIVWKNRKMGDLSNCERKQIIGVHLAGASVTKTATLSGVLRETVDSF